MQQAAELAEWLSSPGGKGEDLGAIANTLAQRRAHHDYRASFVAETHEQAVEALQKFVKGTHGSVDGIAQGRVQGAADSISRQAVWVFSGHGAQWTNMGKELLGDPVFRQVIESLNAIYIHEAGFSLVAAYKSATEAAERSWSSGNRPPVQHIKVT